MGCSLPAITSSIAPFTIARNWTSSSTATTRGSPLNPADHGKLAEEAGRTAEFIAQLGASRFVVRPMGPYFKEAPITDDKIKTVAECWSKAGEATKGAGVKTAMHSDFLCGVRNESDIDKVFRSGRTRTAWDSPWTQRS